MRRSRPIAPCAWLAVVLLASGVHATESAFPYRARVVSEKADVRCGPSAEDYATQQLRRGAEVEVYRRDAGGWLAIRPPADAFSLVAARYLKISDSPDIAEVMDPHAVAWIGVLEEGSVPELKWQIRLDVGERVVVLGEEMRRVRSAGPLEKHLRIAPPRGEFRWVAESDVRHPSQPTEEAVAGSVAVADFRVVPDPSTDSQRRDGFVARGSRTESTDDATSTSPASSSAGKKTAKPAEPALFAEADSDAPAGASSETDAEFDARVRNLDVRLSLALARPAADWQLDGIRRAATRLADDAETTVQRARAQILLETIAESERLQSRLAAVDERTEDREPDTTDATHNETTSAADSSSPSANPRFDGTGWLAPVWSRTRSAPPYALVNVEGQVLQWVSPAPGMNLHRYLRKEVGVFGQRSFKQHLDKPHLTAERVVELKRHR